MLRRSPFRAVPHAATLALLLVGAASASRADAIVAVNRAREGICGVRPALQETRSLDAAALRLARGATLHDALAAVEPRPEYAASIQIVGTRDDAELARALGSRYCRDLGRPGIREVGVARSGPRLYLVLAEPLAVPASADRPQVEHDVLRRVNVARARARYCGRTWFPSAPPLQLSAALSAVASGHSADMARRSDLAHEDPDGSTPADRVRRSGYPARLVGENVASGVPTGPEVVAGWLASPDHCANLMDGRFTEMGIAFAVSPRSAAGIYWTQLFAAPRS